MSEDRGSPPPSAPEQRHGLYGPSGPIWGVGDPRSYAATGHFPYARCGESGFCGLLTSHDHIVGFLVPYITPEGEKSTVAPLRRRFMLAKALDAVFVQKRHQAICHTPCGTLYRTVSNTRLFQNIVRIRPERCRR
jgi:hypothetical protein